MRQTSADFAMFSSEDAREWDFIQRKSILSVAFIVNPSLVLNEIWSEKGISSTLAHTSSFILSNPLLCTSSIADMCLSFVLLFVSCSISFYLVLLF